MELHSKPGFKGVIDMILRLAFIVQHPVHLPMSYAAFNSANVRFSDLNRAPWSVQHSASFPASSVLSQRATSPLVSSFLGIYRFILFVCSHGCDAIRSSSPSVLWLSGFLSAPLFLVL